MKATEPFSIRKRLRSFRFALNGLRQLIVREHNARIHLVVACLVISLGIVYQLSTGEWVVVLLCIGSVFSIEAINSAIETLCDEVTEERKESIQVIKDLSAGAVLIAALTSVVVGAIIFLPKILNF